MSKMNKIALVVAVAAATVVTAPAHAVLYSFFRITNNGNTNVSSQLSVDVTANGSQVDFTFYNNVGVAASIADVYFDDGTLLGIASITDSGAGVDFSQLASPGNLPGANGADPDFNTTAGFSADSNPPVSANGVNASSEWLTITFNLINGQTFADTIAALADGTLRIGLHVQAIGDAGGSDSYVNNGVVPLPGAALLGALGLGLVGWRKNAAK